jgi:V8-like Glu-specific endopeptidase
MTKHGLLSRTGVFALLSFPLLFVGVAEAQTYGYTKPAQLPQSAADTSKGLVPPPVARSVNKELKRNEHASPAQSGNALIDGMTATMRSRDGKEATIQLPANLRNRLLSGDKGGASGLQAQQGKLVQITDTTQYPYTTVGLFANGCTGVMIGIRFVLTSGDCAFNLETGAWRDGLDFSPAYNGKEAPYGTVKWKNVWAPTGYTKEKNIDFSYALIELDEDIGDKTGWMGFSHFSDFSFKRLNVTGYPVEGVPERTMWETTCRISSVHPGYFYYQCPGKYQTVTAMGAGPIWHKGTGETDVWVTGIHIGSVDDNKSHWAVRLSDANATLLLSWMQPRGENVADDQGTDDVTNVTDCTCETKPDKTDENDDNDRIIKPVIPGSNTQQ